MAYLNLNLLSRSYEEKDHKKSQSVQKLDLPKFEPVTSRKRVYVRIPTCYCPVVNLQTSSTVFRIFKINCVYLRLFRVVAVKRNRRFRMTLLSRGLWCCELIHIATCVLHMPVRVLHHFILRLTGL